MAIMRVRAVITGVLGLPGVHTTYWTGASSSPVTADATDVVARVRAFWDSFKANMGPGVVIAPNNNVDVLDQATGALQGSLAGGSVASVAATGATLLPFQTMMLLKLGTGVVVNGRRLQGRSFIGPLAASTNTGGNVVAAANTALTTAAASFNSGATSSALVVWHRPSGSPPSGGTTAVVTTYNTSTVFAVLRSRRD